MLLEIITNGGSSTYWSERKISDILPLILITVTILITLWYLIRPIDEATANIMETAYAVLLSGGTFIGFSVVSRQFGLLKTKQGRILTALAVGFLLWCLAETAWFVFVLEDIDPYPSIADGLWIAGYLMMLSAIITNAIMIPTKSSRSMILLWISLSVLYTLIVVTFVINPFFTGPVDLEVLVSLAYPLLDIAIFIPTIFILMKFKSGTVSRPWLLLGIGLIIISTIGDLLFTYKVANDTYSPPYDPVDFVLLIAYLVFIGSSLLFIRLYRKAGQT